MTPNDPTIIVALDCDTPGQALGLAKQLDPSLCRLKVGKQLFTRAGPGVVADLRDLGFEIFLDLKFHDIPNTVARACRAAADLGVWMLNVHALGGFRMMEDAADAVAQSRTPPKLTAVTVLTSHEPAELTALGLEGGPAALSLHLAEMAQDAGLDGVVASPQEARSLRVALGPEWLIVTPGIRAAEVAEDDQRRVMTPEKALAAGASYLVLGRMVTRADDPAGTLRTIASEIRQ